MNQIKQFFTENGAVYIISQLISVVATFFLLFSYQQKTHKRIVGMQAVAGLLFGTQYLMLGAYEGMVCNYIGAIRCITYSFRTKNKFVDSLFCPALFAVAFIISGIITYTNPFSLLPIVAMCIASFVTWNIKTQQLRGLTLPTSLMWLVYNAWCGSIVAVGTELLSEISIFIGLFRFRKKKKEK